MDCLCGIRAFTYEKIDNCKKCRIYKCGTLILDSKRKTRCNFNVCTFIKDVVHTEPECKEIIKTLADNIIPEVFYKERLNRYIYLYEITYHLTPHFRQNYIANINYILYKLNFPLFFEENENISNLKNRILKKCEKRPIKICQNTLNVIPYSKEFSNVTPKIKTKKKITTVKSVPVIKIDIDYLASIDIVDIPSVVKVEKLVESDPESDEESADETFDVDNFDSCDEEEEYDGGDISD